MTFAVNGGIERKAMNQSDEVKALTEAGVGRVQIMVHFKISKASCYRCLKALEPF